MQGVGAVSPLFALHDGNGGRVYFYDAMGAQFEVADFAATGSGSPAVRSILHYADRWSGSPLRDKRREESIVLALRSLETAAVSDTATGGVDRRQQVFPIVKIITAGGIETIEHSQLAEAFQREVA
jgi:proteasome beta subunit